MGHNSPRILVVFPGEGKQVLGCLTKGVLNQTEHESRTAKRWVWEGTPDRIVLGLGTKANLGLTTLLIDRRYWTNPYPCLFGFLAAKRGVLHRLEVGTSLFCLTNIGLLGRVPQVLLALNDVRKSWGEASRLEAKV